MELAELAAEAVTPMWFSQALPRASWLVLLLGGCKGTSSSSSPTKHEDELRTELAQKLDGAKAGEEREIEPGVFMTMFRSQAVAPLPDGWQLATSTRGSFSVEIPLPFNDFRMRSQSDDHVEMFADVVGAKSPGLLSWSATCATRADGKIGRPGGPPLTNAIEPEGTPVRAWQRTIVLDARVCLLIVEAQGTDPLPPDSDIQRFLHSFKETRR